MTDRILQAWVEAPHMDRQGRPHYRAAWHERQPDGALRRRRQSLWPLGVRTQAEADEWVRQKSARLNGVREALPDISAREGFTEYLNDLRLRTTRRTWQETGTLIARFLALTGAGPRPLVEITKSTIRDYLDGRLAGTHRGYDPVAKATRDAELRVLAAAFRRLCKPPFEFVGSDPTAGLLPLSRPVCPKGGRSGRLRRAVGRGVQWLRRWLRRRQGRTTHEQP